MNEEQAQLISEAARKLLEERDFYAAPVPSDSRLFNVFDADGSYCFCCTATIDATNLGFMMAYGKREFLRGERHGAEHLAETIRGLIGAAAAPVET